MKRYLTFFFSMFASGAIASPTQWSLPKVLEVLEAQQDFGDFVVNSTVNNSPHFVGVFFDVNSDLIAGRLENHASIFAHPYFNDGTTTKLEVTESTDGETVVTLTTTTSYPFGNPVIPNSTPVSFRLKLTIDEVTQNLTTARLMSWYMPSEFGVPVWIWRKVYDIKWNN